MGSNQSRELWNKGKLVGQKPPLKPKDVWAIRIHLQHAHAVRDLALFNLAIESKLRGCDLVNLHVRDVTHGNQILPRAMIMEPVRFSVCRGHETITEITSYDRSNRDKEEQDPEGTEAVSR
ncbi:hypothetical protein B0G80_4841 [Paraburkholderia sp. BL6669N2]|nr:hypothetical protein B0G80_4841 [Paraburkholderia sp. BL6669N2]